MDPLHFERTYTVHLYETGPDGRLNLDFIMNNSPQSAEINYLAESVINEEIKITLSHENNSDGLYNHSILRTSDNKELCRIRIEWKEQNIKKVV